VRRSGAGPGSGHVALKALFPTLVYTADLPRTGALERRLLRECLQLRADDPAGRRWSARNYPGGYTSYGSQHRLYEVSPTFNALRRALQRHVAAFVKALQWDMSGRRLAMTDCWVNIMPRRVAHGMHLHPLASVSGTYYVRVPRGSPGLKLEDPRLTHFMAAPPRRTDSDEANRPWVVLPAAAGRVILFESWLRHEVPANPTASERISVSFNYGWF